MRRRKSFCFSFFILFLISSYIDAFPANRLHFSLRKNHHGTHNQYPTPFLPARLATMGFHTWKRAYSAVPSERNKLTSITKSMVTIDKYIVPTTRQAWRLLRKKRCKSTKVGLGKFYKQIGEENRILVKGRNIAKLGKKFFIAQSCERLHKAAGDNKSINGNHLETSSANSLEVSEIFRNCSNHFTRKKINSSEGNNEFQPGQRKMTFWTATSPVSRMATAASIARVSSFARSSLASSSRSTALNMVLSTPDTIIEQASTQKLLDTLIDESVRTSSREPVMLQFNPKRGWVSVSVDGESLISR